MEFMIIIILSIEFDICHFVAKSVLIDHDIGKWKT